MQPDLLGTAAIFRKDKERPVQNGLKERLVLGQISGLPQHRSFRIPGLVTPVPNARWFALSDGPFALRDAPFG